MEEMCPFPSMSPPKSIAVGDFGPLDIPKKGNSPNLSEEWKSSDIFRDGLTDLSFLDDFGAPYQICYSKIPLVISYLSKIKNIKDARIADCLIFLARFTFTSACVQQEKLCQVWTEKMVECDLMNLVISKYWDICFRVNFIKETCSNFERITAKKFIRNALKKPVSKLKSKDKSALPKVSKRSNSLTSVENDSSLVNKKIGGLKSESEKSENNLKKIKSEEPIDLTILEIYLSLQTLLWNGSNSSSELCQKIVQGDFISKMLQVLTRDDFDPEKFSTDTIRTQISKAMMGVMHNCFRYQREITKDAFRNANGVKIILKYSKSDVPIVSTKSFIILAYGIEENEIELINAQNDILNFIHQELLLKAMNSPSRTSLGFTIEETLNALSELAQSDANKSEMMAFVDDIESIVTGHLNNQSSKREMSNEDELAAALRLLWMISFHPDNQPILRERDKLTSVITVYQKREKDCGKVNNLISKSCRGFLWNLGVEKTPVEAIINGHVMISYDHKHKEVVRQLNEKLKYMGYNTWLDADKMSGSTLEAMAEAVEQASVIVVCMSQRYKDSPSCRTEAEYAYRLRKDIVPIRTQCKYVADGWLGILMGTRLYFDCFDLDQVQKCAEKVANELNERGRRDIKNTLISNTNEHQPDSESASKTLQWSISDVQTWLKTQNMESMMQCMSEIDGELIFELKRMQDRAPQAFYNYLMKFDKKLKIVDLMRFSKCLNDLT